MGSPYYGDPALYVEPPPPPRRTVPSFKFEVGPSLRELYGIGFYGALLGLGLGADSGNLGIHALIQGFVGSTTFGLPTGQLRYGVSFEGRFDRFRFGGGAVFSSLFVRRVTKGTSMTDFSVGPEIHFTWDAVRVGRTHAFYIGARATVDFLLLAVSPNSGTPVMPDITLLAGLRI